MTAIKASCWKCGRVQEEILLPLSRIEECQHCTTDLHVCRMCRFYDTSVNNACREPIADFVSDKTRANFCGYLELRADAREGSGSADAVDTTDELNSLFGLDDTSTDTIASVNDLFGKDDFS
ncbi:MAG: hypothetical protein VCB07_10250 [Gammaproteobacteria bacterium]